jgi:transcriptional regulator with XRE-family HTH domain
MSPLKPGNFEFKKEELVMIRKRLGVSQGKMADLLGIPPNTVSRWEKGATVPDANYLAAMYSIAREHGIIPEFFGLRGDTIEIHPTRQKLVVLWDFQTLGTPANWVRSEEARIQQLLNQRLGDMPDVIYRAFTHPDQRLAVTELEKLGWSVREGGSDIVKDIENIGKSIAGQEPDKTVIVLISNDNIFVELIEELKNWGVQVYVISNQPYDNKLLKTSGPRFGINWSPMVQEMPKRNRNLSGGILFGTA